jgi:hypothetical protein
MTSEELAALPEGTIIWCDHDCGEILVPGRICQVIWEDPPVTIIMYTDSPAWGKFIKYLTLEESKDE